MWLCLKKYQEFFLPFYGHKLNDMQFLGCTLVGTALAMLTPTNFCEAEILSLFLKEKGLGICIFCLCACWDSPVSVCLSLPFFTCCPPQTAAWDLMSAGDSTSPAVLSPSTATPSSSSTAYFIHFIISQFQIKMKKTKTKAQTWEM